LPTTLALPFQNLIFAVVPRVRIPASPTQSVTSLAPLGFLESAARRSPFAIAIELHTSASCWPFDRECGLEWPSDPVWARSLGKRRGRSSPTRAHAAAKMCCASRSTFSPSETCSIADVNAMVTDTVKW